MHYGLTFYANNAYFSVFVSCLAKIVSHFATFVSREFDIFLLLLQKICKTKY